MVNPQNLDRIFLALADPTRRAILARLSKSDTVTIADIARPFPISLTAVHKHVAVLSDAGLVERRRIGRNVHCQINIQPIRSAASWLEHYERFWTARLERLARLVEADK